MELTRTRQQGTARKDKELQEPQTQVNDTKPGFKVDRVTDNLSLNSWIFVKTKKSYRGYYRLHKINAVIPADQVSRSACNF